MDHCECEDCCCDCCGDGVCTDRAAEKVFTLELEMNQQNFVDILSKLNTTNLSFEIKKAGIKTFELSLSPSPFFSYTDDGGKTFSSSISSSTFLGADGAYHENPKREESSSGLDQLQEETAQMFKPVFSEMDILSLHEWTDEEQDYLIDDLCRVQNRTRASTRLEKTRFISKETDFMRGLRTPKTRSKGRKRSKGKKAE